jgi:hypothetical protein
MTKSNLRDLLENCKIYAKHNYQQTINNSRAFERKYFPLGGCDIVTESSSRVLLENGKI